MIPQTSPLSPFKSAAPPLVLVADEDVHTLGLIQTVFLAEHFRVITAHDGDEAIRRALAERPDLVVLEVRLPKRNGFEVCDYLRHDPEDPNVPVMFVATAADADVRTEGLARGADDFLAKPYVPRELVARARRLLVRAADMRAQRRRTSTLEHDLGKAQEESRRTLREVARERRLRELAWGFGRDLQSTLDPEELAERMLAQAMRQLGAPSLALLAPDDGGDEVTRLVARAFRGASAVRFGGVALELSGELAATLAGLGRPTLLHELERWPGLRAELAPFISAGAALLAPLRGPGGLEGLLVADERIDGAPWTTDDRLAVGALCDLGAIAHQNARRYLDVLDRTLELSAAQAHVQPRAALAAAESARLAEAASSALGLPARERRLLRLAVAFGSWGWGDEGRAALRTLAAHDSSRRVQMLAGIIARGESLELAAARTPAERQATLIAGVCARHQVGRRCGRSLPESWNTAVAWAGATMDPGLAEALATALRSVSAAADTPRAA